MANKQFPIKPHGISKLKHSDILFKPLNYGEILTAFAVFRQFLSKFLKLVIMKVIVFKNFKKDCGWCVEPGIEDLGCALYAACANLTYLCQFID